jgi:hypothetical protein
VLLREEKGMIIFFTEVRRDRVEIKPLDGDERKLIKEKRNL